MLGAGGENEMGLVGRVDEDVGGVATTMHGWLPAVSCLWMWTRGFLDVGGGDLGMGFRWQGLFYNAIWEEIV